MAAAISLVTHVIGQVWVRDADGSLSPVAEGMQITAHADVVTAAGASVQLQVNGQPALTIGENRDVQLGTDMAQAELDPSIAAVSVPTANLFTTEAHTGQETADVSLFSMTSVGLSDVFGDVGSGLDMGAVLDAALPAERTEAVVAPQQEAAHGNHAVLDAVADQHQLLQQIVDAGKQGTDLI